MIDFGPYAFTLDDSGCEMDDLHVQMLFNAVMGAKPRVVTEVGSYRGRSTIAYVEALKHGACFDLHLVEILPQDSLLRLIGESGFGNRVTVHRKPSWELMIPSDFIFIDGDHAWPALADAMVALALGTPVIAMHDSNSHEHGFPGTWGSHMAAGILKAAPGRTWFEDAAVRPGMRTHRGFAVSKAARETS